MAARRAKASVRLLTGDKELDRKLERLKIGTANRIARRGLGKAVRLGVKATKAQIPAHMKDAKRAIAGVLDQKGKGGTHRAKFGAGVGKGSAAEREKRAQGKIGLAGLILGTEGRSHRSGHSTGVMPPQIPDAVKAGFSSASGAMLAAIKEEVAKGLAAEAKK